MTDMTLADALAKIKQRFEEEPVEVLALYRPDEEMTILNAAASDALIPASDNRLAVAEALRKAGEIARIRADQHSDLVLTGNPENARHREAMEAALTEMRWAILALADTDFLAQVQNMRTMLDRALEQNADLAAEVNVLRAERDEFAVTVVNLARQRGAAEAKLAAMVEAMDVINHAGLEAVATVLVLEIAKALEGRDRVVLTNDENSLGPRIVEFAALAAAKAPHVTAGCPLDECDGSIVVDAPNILTY